MTCGDYASVTTATRRCRTESCPSNVSSLVAKSGWITHHFSEKGLHGHQTTKRTLHAGTSELYTASRGPSEWPPAQSCPQCALGHPCSHVQCRTRLGEDLEVLPAPRAAGRSHRPKVRHRANSCCYGVVHLLSGVLCLMAPVLALTCMAQLVIVRAQHHGPTYSSSQRDCQFDTECEQARGEVCWWSYEGCPRGHCRCDPNTSYEDPNSHRCRPVKLGGERCVANFDMCPTGMRCELGICQCTDGLASSNGYYCIPHFSRAVGQNCEPDLHTCYQKTSTAYTPTEVSCRRGTCRCTEGFKELSGACTTFLVGEAGCLKDHHCQGGALCIDKICKCPSGYHPVAGNSKCAKIEAHINTLVGDTCDEINERRYCAQGLFCHRCLGDAYHTCVKYVHAETGRLINGARSGSPGCTPLVVLVVVLYFLLS